MFLSFANFIAFVPPQGGGAQGGASSMLVTLIMFASIFLIMYLLMIRPAQKRQKEHQKMLESLKIGDRVVTTAGIHGTIVSMDGATVTLQVSDNCKIQFEKSAIAGKKQ
ncbi:MAG: preprotein translocase subunit YajC [Ignavibacteria bacterium]|nr:preprotein translocase subunit YajC [Ignavibacteria bacterium]